MAKNLKLLLSFIVAFEADTLLPALAQSNQPKSWARISIS
jgi:hypothetical protein